MKTIVIAFLILAGLVSEIPASWEKACRKTVTTIFKGDNVSISKRSAKSCPDGRPSPGMVLYDIVQGGKIKGYVIATSARGRHEYFDYLVIYDTALIIQKIRVFEYRSDHGYEICNKKWLKQFEGKPGCGLQYGKDIDGISGATYSASSLTRDVSHWCEYLANAIK